MQLITLPVNALQELIACRSVSTNDEDQHAARQKIVNILEKNIVQK